MKADVAVALLVVAIVLLMIIPIPDFFAGFFPAI